MQELIPTVVVVGGSSGLGKVVAETYAEIGYRVAIVSRNKPRFIDTKDKITHFSADLTDLTSCAADELAALISRELGSINYIIFCQRYRGNDRSLATEMAVSIISTDILIQALQPYFSKKGDRAIAAVGSVYADFVGASQPLSYHIVKAGLNALVRYYAVRLGDDRVRVNAIAPLTYLKDESKSFYLESHEMMEKYRRLVPLKRMPTAQECANVLHYLCSPQASFVNGQILYVDGGVSAIWPEEFA